jgi:hypothetical protein
MRHRGYINDYRVIEDKPDILFARYSKYLMAVECCVGGSRKRIAIIREEGG